MPNIFDIIEIFLSERLHKVLFVFFNAYEMAVEKVEIKKDKLIYQVQARLEQKFNREHLPTLRWRVK